MKNEQKKSILIDQFLVKNPSKRLGCLEKGGEEIKSHAFFRQVIMLMDIIITNNIIITTTCALVVITV